MATGARFADKRTEQFFNGLRIKEFASVERSAERRMRSVMTAKTLGTIAAIPGHRLEALRGNRDGQWSIRINDKWRSCFLWDDERAEAFNIEITDYHD